MKIQIKNRWTGSILFEYEKEDNTIKDAVVEAVKQKANLRGADLRGADLRGADLRGADLRGADLCYAYLGDADLREADLGDADLREANLREANLREANFRCADLGGAYLCGTDLRGANLRDADLHEADLRDTHLGDAKEIPYIPFACPSDGAFIGWKKVSDKLIKLQIPEDARRCSATTNKCRCDKAIVLSITDLDGENPVDEVVNEGHYPNITYKVGEMVFPDSFDENRWNECSHGIHFFVNRQEALSYLV